jgi:hypothetical protein
MKTPNIKHQTPNNFQTSTLKRSQMGRATGWCLELGVYLVFGVWCLVFVPGVLG